eukprot:4871352-Pyramimonas_sp.AAC.1
MSQRHIQDAARAAPAHQELFDGQSKPPHAAGRDTLSVGTTVEGEPHVVDRHRGALVHGEAPRASGRPTSPARTR